MAQFDDAKVGTRLWSIQYGWGDIEKCNNREFPIKVRFEKGGAVMYTLEGKEFSDDINPTLFWSEVKIDPPERPLEDCPNCVGKICEDYACCLNCGYKKPKEPKEKCKACEKLNQDDFDWYREIKFLLNQHHTCEKKND